MNDDSKAPKRTLAEIANSVPFNDDDLWAPMTGTQRAVNWHHHKFRSRLAAIGSAWVTNTDDQEALKSLLSRTAVPLGVLGCSPLNALNLSDEQTEKLAPRPLTASATLTEESDTLVANVEVQPITSLKGTISGRAGIRISGGGEVRAAGKRSSPKVELPPGSRMLSIAEIVFSPKTKEHVFDQIVADFREEYFAATHERNYRKVRFIIARYWIGFIVACICEGAVAVGRVIRAVKGAG